jgi:23S rRNA (guanosine2251-2'-O)-methyltransferase
VRNFGGIARTVECAGADALVVPFNETAQLNADAMKTSAGALHHLPVCREISMKKAVSFLQNSGVRVYAASEKARQLYHEMNYTVPIAIILGSEEKGISSGVLSEVDGIIKLPMEGRVGSLNVSAAASVLVYEVVRQRFVTR